MADRPVATHAPRAAGEALRQSVSDSICDAGFHRFAPEVSEPDRCAIEAEGGGLRPRLEWAEMQQNRFVGLIDGEGGTSASRSLREFGESGTVLFKTESHQAPAAEFWYALLRPYVHYVPLSPSLEDLEDRLAWARANDGEARRIAENAARLKRRLLTRMPMYSATCAPDGGGTRRHAAPFQSL